MRERQENPGFGGLFAGTLKIGVVAPAKGSVLPV